LACESCEVTVWNVKEGCETNECRNRASQYGITRYPSVVVDGELLSCCKEEGPTRESLIAAGIGQLSIPS